MASSSTSPRVERLIAQVGISRNDTHCQVPCGIFDDPLMVAELRQHCATTRKAIQSLAELRAAPAAAGSRNQTVRWIAAKDEHADKVISTVSEYCLCQRVKPEAFASEKDYEDALKAHHAAMQAAMKVKQSLDPAVVAAMEHAVADMCEMYQPVKASGT